MDFQHALADLLNGGVVRRAEWRPDKLISVVWPAEDGAQPYLKITMSDGRHAPYTPSQCDLFAHDWVEL